MILKQFYGDYLRETPNPEIRFSSTSTSTMAPEEQLLW